MRGSVRVLRGSVGKTRPSCATRRGFESRTYQNLLGKKVLLHLRRRARHTSDKSSGVSICPPTDFIHSKVTDGNGDVTLPMVCRTLSVNLCKCGHGRLSSHLPVEPLVRVARETPVVAAFDSLQLKALRPLVLSVLETLTTVVTM